MVKLACLKLEVVFIALNTLIICKKNIYIIRTKRSLLSINAKIFLIRDALLDYKRDHDNYHEYHWKYEMKV